MDIGGEQTCLSCGEQQEADDRYCGRCGTPAVTAALTVESRLVPRPEPELLLGPPSDEGPPRRLDPVAMALGAVVASLLGLSAMGLLRSSTIEVSSVGDGLIGILTVDSDVAELVAVGRRETVSVFETFRSHIVGADEPLMVERETGTSLLAASASAWTLIDLDTGERQELQPQGLPVLVSDSHLVVERDEALWSIPLSELGHNGTGVRLFELGVDDDEDRLGLLAASLSGFDELVVVSYRSDGWRQIARLDLSTGDQAGPEDTPSSPFARPNGGLHEVVGAGTFDVIDDSWTKISDGAPVIAAPGSTLVHVCAGRLECRYEWLDRKSGQPLDRPVPKSLIEADRRRSFLLPLDLFGHVIATFGPDEFMVIDTAKERVLAFNDVWPAGLGDGRALVAPVLPLTARLGLVAVPVESGLELLDLEDDVRYRVEQGFFGPRPPRYVLVPS